MEAWGKLTAKVFGKLRVKVGLIPKGVPEDQEWYWSEKWQKMEREADEALARGEFVDFEDIEDAIAYLHRQT